MIRRPRSGPAFCGDDDVFAHTRARHDAKGRFVSADDVIAADPDGIIASGCGK